MAANVTRGIPDGPVVFVSYSHEDKALIHKVDVYLGPRLPDGVSLWHDEQIRVGDRWDGQVGTAIDKSLLAVLLVSREFPGVRLHHAARSPALPAAR